MMHLNHEHYNHHHHKKRRITFLVLLFFFILIAMIYSSFFAEVSIIGNVINNEKDLGGKIPVVIDLDSIPYDLSIKSESNKVIIRGSSDSFINVGEEKFYFNSSTTIIITDFKGKFNLNEKNITYFKGTASRVSIEGVPLFPRLGDSLKIYFDDIFNYDSIEISDGALIKDINYPTSGKVEIDSKKTIVNLKEDFLDIKNFYGSIKIIDDKLKLKGLIKRIQIIGNHSILVD